MKFEAPPMHRQVVDELMNGKFVLSHEKHFESIKNNIEFYEDYFQKSFGYELFFTQEFAYLVSTETNENLSRDISIFMALFCYELDKEGTNFLDTIQFGEITLTEVDRLFENSSYSDLIASNNQLKNSEARQKLLRSMSNKNILTRISEDKYYFTPAHKVFIEFAKELAQQKRQEAEQEKEY